MNTVEIIEAKIAKLNAEGQAIADKIIAGVSKATEKRLDAKYDELTLKIEVLMEVMEEIEEAPKAEKKAAPQPLDVKVVKPAAAPAADVNVDEDEDAAAAPAKTVYQAIIEQYGEDVIMNNKAMIARIKRETVKKITIYDNGEGRFTSNGRARRENLHFDYSVSVEWVKKYNQFKVLAN